MRTYSLNELLHLTRTQLFARHAEIVAALAELPEEAPERLAMLDNLRLIRRVLATVKLAL